MIELIEVEPGKWRVKRSPREIARSDLPLPNVISDTMEPTEQVDGKFYTSKSQFRKVGRSLGLTEVGNEKQKPRRKTYDAPAFKEKRRETIKRAFEQYKSGRRR
jgi:hypothetical protein